jgi:hypothetical protein
LSVPTVPFGWGAAWLARVDPPLRRVEPPLRALPFGDRFAPLREAAAEVARGVVLVAVFFAACAAGAPPLDRVFGARVPDAAFEADVARARLAVLLRVPPLDRFVLAMGSSNVCRQVPRSYPRAGGS